MTDEPALAPESVEATEQEYEVIAGKVFGLEPGKTFKRTLTPSEERLVGTHIRKVGEADTDDADTGDDDNPPAPTWPLRTNKDKE